MDINSSQGQNPADPQPQAPAMRRCHRLSDFLWFVALGGVPEVVAIVAIADQSLVWMGAYIAFMLVFGAAEVTFLCRRCPYYAQGEGRTVHCKAMWGPTRWLVAKTGPLSPVDRVMLYLFFFLAFAFPLYWLALRPFLLIIYLWSIVNMIWTLGRYECNRCMYLHCPFNRFRGDLRDELPCKVSGNEGLRAEN